MKLTWIAAGAWLALAGLADIARAAPQQDEARAQIERKVARDLQGREITQRDPEREAIVAAVGEYVDAFYLMEPERLERGVAPDLVKYGFTLGADGAYEGAAMTRDTLKAIAARFHEYVDVTPETPREIAVLDHHDKIAVAKLTAAWGVDHLHLAKLDGGWRIVQVLWQTPPRPVDAETAAADERAIRRAVLDYVESAYEVRPELVDRSVSRDLAKIGFTKRAVGEEWRRSEHDFASLRSLVARWNADGHMPKDPRKDVVVLDRLDKIASATAVAEWGIDELQLEKGDDGVWRVRHVVWQSHPLAPAGSPGDARGR